MVLWNNVDLNNYGIIVESTPKISKAKKRITVHEIYGRSDFLTVDEGTYEPFTISIACHCKENNLNNVKSFLDGVGRLSLDGIKEYKAVIKNAISFEKVDKFKKFVVQFYVNPIAYDITETSVNITSAEQNIVIDSADTKMYPVLTIVGNGNVNFTFNNKTFILNNLDSSKTYTLDCEKKLVVDNNMNNVSNQMQYDFPYLIPGSNTISYLGTVSSFNIKYKKAYF